MSTFSSNALNLLCSGTLLFHLQFCTTTTQKLHILRHSETICLLQGKVQHIHLYYFTTFYIELNLQLDLLNKLRSLCEFKRIIILKNSNAHAFVCVTLFTFDCKSYFSQICKVHFAIYFECFSEEIHSVVFGDFFYLSITLTFILLPTFN